MALVLWVLEGLQSVPLAMFQMFDELPMSSILSVIAIVLILVIFYYLF